MSEPHSRFWASLEAFRCACPACGAIVLSHKLKGGGGGAWRSQDATNAYDRRTQILRCPWCTRRFQAGLLLYPLPLGTPGAKRRGTPPDVKVTGRVLHELRNLYGGGWWMQTRSERGDPVNLYVPAECSCAPLPWSASCPVHGGEGLITDPPDPSDESP